jgi:lipopolysaccharide heptosyltransferase II
VTRLVAPAPAARRGAQGSVAHRPWIPAAARVLRVDPSDGDAPLAWPSPPEPERVVPPRPPEVRPWSDVRRRLAIRLDAAGDLLMTTPAIRALRARGPGEWLAVLTSSAGAEVAALLPEVDEVIAWDPPWMPGSAAPGGAEATLVERLRDGRYDGAAIFTVHSQSALPAALLCRLAGIPRRLAHAAETPYGLLTDWVPEPERDAPRRHETRRQLDLLAAVGVVADEPHLSVHVPADAAVAMRASLASLGLAEAPFVVVHPGARAPSRRYPAAGFAALVRALVRDHGVPVVLTGSAEEAGLAARVRALAGVEATSLAGDLDLGELGALLALAPLLVSGNTATVHLAAAVGTPVVVAYAGTNSQHTPWGVPARVLTAPMACSGCRRSTCPLGHGRCLSDIPPEALVAASLDLLAEWGPGDGA